MIRISGYSSGDAVDRIVINPRIPAFVILSHPTRTLTSWEWSTNFDLKPKGIIAYDADPGNQITDVVFHPEGRILAVSRLRGPIGLLTFPDGILFQIIGSGTGYTAISFSPDSKCILAICSFPFSDKRFNRIEVYSLPTGQLIHSYFEANVGFAWHPSGDLFATASTGQAGSCINFSRYHFVPPLLDLAFMSALRPTGIQFSPNGASFAVVGDQDGLGIELVEFPSCRLLSRTIYQPTDNSVVCDILPSQVAYTHDGTRLCIPLITGRVAVLDANDGTELGSSAANSSPATAIRIAPSDEFCIVGHQDGQIAIHKIVSSGAPASAAVSNFNHTGIGNADSTDDVTNLIFDFNTDPLVVRL